MTSSEIRAHFKPGGMAESLRIEMCAQVAELNENLQKLFSIVLEDRLSKIPGRAEPKLTTR